MTRDLLYALVLFLTGGLGYALGRAHAHEAFDRVMGETLAAIRKHLRAEGGEAREMRRAAEMMAHVAVGFAEAAETDSAAKELKAINESLQRAKSAETTAKVRFEQLYNGERKARKALEGERDTLVYINRSLSRRMAAAFAICRNGCLEASGRANTAAAEAIRADDPANGGDQ
ncbi:MAG: hypothetical protein OXU74_06695 [Gemmatimonadota bacterium]|nr:hypothetical protein [Gemmatimonadota bacterium]